MSRFPLGERKKEYLLGVSTRTGRMPRTGRDASLTAVVVSGSLIAGAGTKKKGGARSKIAPVNNCMELSLATEVSPRFCRRLRSVPRRRHSQLAQASKRQG